MPPKKAQSSLDAFFGGGATKRKSPSGTAAATAPPTIQRAKKRLVIEDTSDEEEEDGKNVATPTLKENAAPAKDPSAFSSSKEAIEKSDENGKKTVAKKVQPAEDMADKKSTIGKKGSNSLTNNSKSHEKTEKATTNVIGKKHEEPSSKTLKEPPSKTLVATSAKAKSVDTTKRIKSALLQSAPKGQFKSDEALFKEATWSDVLPFAVLCQAFADIEEISSRLAIQETLTTLFRKIFLKTPNSMTDVLYLASNSVAAAYECVELGIGDALLIKAVAGATGTSDAIIKQKYESAGDLGSVAAACKGKQKTLGGFFGAAAKAPLTVAEVLKVFREIAETKGNQAQKGKIEKIKKLVVRSTTVETKYIIRGLQGKLRIGLAQSTVLISLAHALALTTPPTVNINEPSNSEEPMPEEAIKYLDDSLPVEKRLDAAVAIIKKAYSEVPSYEAILEAALAVPLQLVHTRCQLKPGIPVAPMLAKPTKSIQEVLKRLTGLRFTCEYKYDGERAQVHMLPDGTTKVFSRNLLDTSEKYPEVPAFVKEACKDVTSFVLDAEVVAYNQTTGQLVPFQILSTRKKTEESAETAKVQVIVEAFDLMFLNGESLLCRTLSERRDLLHQHFQPVESKFQFAKSLDHQENGDTAVLEEFLEMAVKGQCEGLMVKTLDENAIYEPSRRSLNWLKLKKDYLEGLGDSFDLVPLGAYHGRGKRTGFYGAYLLACYNPETEEFQSVCKIGTGFSDEDLKSLAATLNQHQISIKSSQYNVSPQLECDVWFEAVQVWEVKAADLSKSSAHRGADGKTGETGRGIGLRFPRFERLRSDKTPEDATTSDQILEMYYNQDTILAGNNKNDDEDDDL